MEAACPIATAVQPQTPQNLSHLASSKCTGTGRLVLHRPSERGACPSVWGDVFQTADPCKAHTRVKSHKQVSFTENHTNFLKTLVNQPSNMLNVHSMAKQGACWECQVALV
jgi:hypothetical protein